MEGLINRSVDQTLRDLDSQLSAHFRGLHERRALLTPPAPVFALEHGLDDAELELLKESVRAAVRQGFQAVCRQWSLPFVVYAAESGYEYAGGEYWQTFEESTPGWGESGDRDWIGWMFQHFAADFGGAIPHGAFARRFSIIAWPITHAVLPLDLQRNLARLLFDFRTGLTAQLLQEPDELGIRLASRTGQYTQRFRLFCENTALLGKISAALLSGQDYESPYLLRPTLERLVTGLSRERDSREWLKAAQHSAGHLRTRTSGFVVPAPRPGSPTASRERLPAATDPRLLLRRSQDGWRAYAELPDLSPLTARLPHMDEELRSRRALIAGAARSFIARGQLLFPGYEVRLARWPRPEEPFIKLDKGSTPVNQLIADQCVVTGGPPWLFRCRASGPAFEVRGKALHPGSSYILVTRDTSVPELPWMTETTIEADGVRAFRVDVPRTLDTSGIEALQSTGVTIASDVAVRPAGITASRWDGEGAVEWLAGEPGIIAISAEQTPTKCTVTADGQQTPIAWPGQQRELLLQLDDMSPGTREVSVTLEDANGTVTADGSLLVTVRDPQVRPESATSGEGIRLLADPAQPALSDLWDGRAAVSVDGPYGSTATLTVTLSPGPEPLHRSVCLPVTPSDWSRIAAGIREDKLFQRAYDDAESATVTVRRPGIGFASLTCDRGFEALRWRIARRHNGGHTARLIDHSDGTRTKTELFRVSDPLTPVAQPVSGEISLPGQGGLLRATAGDAHAVVLLPTEPTMLIRHHVTPPSVRTGRPSPAEVTRLADGYRMWASAERPADPFAGSQLSSVLNVIASETVSLVAGGRWARLEHRMLSAAQAPERYLDKMNEMKRCVGDSSRGAALAEAVSLRLWEWTDQEKLCQGFAEAMSEAGAGNPATAGFLLALASQPDRIITDWDPAERDVLIGRALAWPMLLRAARYAVLGTRALQPGDPATEGTAT